MRYSVQIAAGDGFDWNDALDYARSHASVFETTAEYASYGSLALNVASVVSVLSRGPGGLKWAYGFGLLAGMADTISAGGYYAHGRLTGSSHSYTKAGVAVSFIALDIFTGGLGAVGGKSVKYGGKAVEMYYAKSTGWNVGRASGLLRGTRQSLTGVIGDPVQDHIVNKIDED